MTEFERIKAIRNYTGLSQAKFGEALGVSRDVINNLERGRAELKEYILKLICTVYGINEAWIRSGEGEMIAPMTPDEEFHQILTEIEFSGDTVVKELLRAYWNLSENEKAAIRKLIDGLKNA